MNKFPGHLLTCLSFIFYTNNLFHNLTYFVVLYLYSQLIPFLDQQLLIDAMKDGNTKLTEQEKQRNQHKSHLFYRACPIGRVKSPVELINYDFYRKSVNCGESELSQFYASITRSVVEDFPSLSRLPFTHKIQRIPVYVRYFSSLYIYCNNES